MNLNTESNTDDAGLFGKSLGVELDSDEPDIREYEKMENDRKMFGINSTLSCIEFCFVLFLA